MNIEKVRKAIKEGRIEWRLHALEKLLERDISLIEVKDVMKDIYAICGGNKGKGTATFTVDYGIGILVARNVPAKVCQQCGEAWLDDMMAKKLEVKTKEAKTIGRQLEVIDLKKAA